MYDSDYSEKNELERRKSPTQQLDSILLLSSLVTSHFSTLALLSPAINLPNSCFLHWGFENCNKRPQMNGVQRLARIKELMNQAATGFSEILASWTKMLAAEMEKSEQIMLCRVTKHGE